MKIHPLSPADATAITAMRAFLAANPRKMTRPLYDQLLEQVPDAAVEYTAATVGGVPGTWCRPAHARSGTLVYLHGGAYVFGSAHAYRHVAGQLAARTRLATFVVDYRLAPEHRFPAALDDARAVCAALAQPMVAGDSAGGGLALALLAEGVASRGVVLSPWTDLAFTGDSMTERATDDPILSQDALEHGAAAYLGDHDRRDPRASPHYGAIMRPVQVHVGTAEILLDDALRLANVDLHVWEGMPHVFQRNVQMLEAARASLDLAAEFLTL